jgi:predicted CXXCH cytochrome family protein
MAEIGVGCESCHGPGEAHAAWAAAPDGDGAARWPGLTATGLTVDLGVSAEVEIEQCAGCHSRREAFFDGNPLPGTPYHDSYNLALLRDGLYAADGQIEAENYEFGSFLQSKMYAKGVRCSDCHDPHSVALRAEGNAVCAQCHSPAGNDRFPTLRKALYDDPEHTFHPAGSEGAACASCHMPQQVYMGVDWRRDHGFRIPRPDLAAATGAPDVCTSCHTDRDPEWAAVEIAERFPDSTHRGPSFATAFAQARRDPAAQSGELMALAERDDLAGIVRATALDMLAPVTDPAIAERTAPLLADPDPLVRGAAATLQRARPPGPRLERLTPVLGDRLRTVRVAAAKAMLGADLTGVPEAGAGALTTASAEWRSALLSRADFPETHMQIGGAALGMRNLDLAESAFREAVALDPQRVEAWVMLARIDAATKGREAVVETLNQAHAANPDDATIRQLMDEVGMPATK